MLEKSRLNDVAEVEGNGASVPVDPPADELAEEPDELLPVELLEPPEPDPQAASANALVARMVV